MTDEPRRPRVGVLALQGAVREHVNAIREVGAEPVEVRLPRDLVDLDALILPGGESTTMRKLIDAYGLREPILSLARGGTPLLGTCAGMILLADRMADGRGAGTSASSTSRCAATATGASSTASRPISRCRASATEPLHGVFIRAPHRLRRGPAGRGAGA